MSLSTAHHQHPQNKPHSETCNTAIIIAARFRSLAAPAASAAFHAGQHVPGHRLSR